MNNKSWTDLAFLALIISSMFLVQIAAGQPHGKPPRFWDIDPEHWERLREQLPLYFTVKTVFATISSILLVLLMVVYVDIYRKTGTRFSLGLVIFSGVLLFYTISSNPFLHQILGFRRIGFGPFMMLPEIFTCIASAILLYLSRQ
jgi:hypothetical protein